MSNRQTQITRRNQKEELSILKHFGKIIKKSVLFLAAIFAFAFGSKNTADAFDGLVKNNKANAESQTLSNDRYIGYGYNVYKGRPLCSTNAVSFSSPILDHNKINPSCEDKDRIVPTEIGQNEVLSYSSNRVSEISERYAEAMSTGVGTSAGVTVSAVKISASVDFNFDTTTSESFGKIQQEEYSYYCIKIKNKQVHLQMSSKELRNVLDDTFKADLYSVKTESDAVNLFERYGTHVLTGYELGGILSMTNYFASNSSSYQRSNTTSFSEAIQTTVDACAGAVGASAGESFSYMKDFGHLDNNSEAVNKFQLRTYGGDGSSFLTIEQAFTFATDLVHGGYYNYQRWIESVNEGTGLAIVDILPDNPMVPLWDLLPISSKYNEARQVLLSKYLELCSKATTSYSESNRDVIISDRTNSDTRKNEYDPEVSGYTYFKNADGKYISSYVGINSTNKVSANSMISIDYNASALANQKVEWKVVTGGSCISKVVDPKTGVFEVSPLAAKGNTFSIGCFVNDVNVGTYKFTISKSSFSGGDGSKDNPYLIATASDFQAFAKSTSLSSHFELVDDIDLTNTSIQVIGSSTSPFSGVFDGGYHTIKGFHYNSNDSKDVGLFGYNTGTIKNLTLVGGSESSHKEVSSYDGSTVRNIGVLCGYNAGTIDNVTVKHFNVNVFNNNKDLETETINIAAGALAGYNTGLVKSSSAVDCEVFAKQIEKPNPDKSGLTRTTSVGGLIGHSKTTKSISADASNLENGILGCTASKVSARAFSGRSGSDTRSSCFIKSYAGGLIGYLEEGSVYQSLVNNIVGNSNFTNVKTGTSVNNCADVYAEAHGAYQYKAGTTAKLPHNAISTKAKDRIFSNAGGLFGKAEESTSFIGNILYSAESINSHIVTDVMSSTTSGKFTNNNIVSGLFGGYSANTSNFTNNYLGVASTKGYSISSSSDIVADTNSLSATKTVLNNSYIMSGTISGATNYRSIITSGLVHKFNLSYSDVEATVDEEYWEETNSLPTIVERSIEIDFDDSNVKKTFFIGDSFKLGDMVINATDSEGNIFKVNSFWVDTSAFTSAAVGKCPITITAYSQSFTYYVDVINPSVTSVFAELTSEGEEATFFEGEDIDFSLFKVEKVFDSGKRVTLEYTSEKSSNSNQYRCEYSSLLPGQNAIKFIYSEDGKSFTYTYYLSVEAKTVKSIKIIQAPTCLEYTVGVSNVSLDGIKVKVEFDQGQSIIVGEESVEAVASVIVEGENTIYVCYGDYYKDSFVVEGKLDLTPLYEFIDKVDSIESAETLRDKFTLISEAIELYDNLNEALLDRAEEAHAKLQAYIDGYNNHVEEINEDFMETVELSQSLNSMMVGAGYSVVGTILLIITKFVY